MEAWIAEQKVKGVSGSTRMTYSKLDPQTNQFANIKVNSLAKLPENLRSKIPSSIGQSSFCACARGVCSKDSGCINFLAQDFCHKGNCKIVKSGDLCTNQTSVLDCMGESVEACWSGTVDLGNAVYCKEHVKEGNRLLEMTGEWLKSKPQKISDRVYLYQYKLDKSIYGVDQIFLNSAFMGNHARFINGRCQPNAQYENWTSERGFHVLIVSTKDIFEGMTVTVDYGTGYSFAPRGCCCGSLQCVSMVTLCRYHQSKCVSMFA